jgi:hypothetical protein
MTNTIIIEEKLFRVSTTLSVYPTFYIQAVDIVSATECAKEIVDYFKNDKVVGTVSTLDTPLLSIVEEE